MFSETNLKTVDFLDITFNLVEENFKPYKKPNSQTLYVNIESNHYNTVLNEIPNSVNQRLTNISSSEIEFEHCKNEYEKALKESGFNKKLKFLNDESSNKKGTENKSKTKNRKRKIIWYNPPFNKALKTDFGKLFFKLLDKHFPRGHKLHKIFNRNTVKLSYSTTPNMKRILQNHNSKILNKRKEKLDKECSCPRTRKNKCILQNKCLHKAIVYKASVLKTGHYYIGVSEADFKHRHARHTYSFRHEKDKGSTTLSQKIWEIGENITPQNPEPKIKWEIIKHSHPRKPGDKTCQLCLEESLQIMKASNDPLCLNQRRELANRCNFYHRAKHKLSNVK